MHRTGPAGKICRRSAGRKTFRFTLCGNQAMEGRFRISQRTRPRHNLSTTNLQKLADSKHKNAFQDYRAALSWKWRTAIFGYGIFAEL